MGTSRRRKSHQKLKIVLQPDKQVFFAGALIAHFLPVSHSTALTEKELRKVIDSQRGAGKAFISACLSSAGLAVYKMDITTYDEMIKILKDKLDPESGLKVIQSALQANSEACGGESKKISELIFVLYRALYSAPTATHPKSLGPVDSNEACVVRNILFPSEEDAIWRKATHSSSIDKVGSGCNF